MIDFFSRSTSHIIIGTRHRLLDLIVENPSDQHHEVITTLFRHVMSSDILFVDVPLSLETGLFATPTINKTIRMRKYVVNRSPHLLSQERWKNLHLMRRGVKFRKAIGPNLGKSRSAHKKPTPDLSISFCLW